MKYLIYSYLIIWILESVIHFTYTYFVVYLCEVRLVIAGIHFTLANSIVIIGLRRPEIFNNPAKNRYKKNLLKENVKNGLVSKLDQYMEKESPYLDPELSFNNVACEMNISTHQLSQLLNTALNINFYDYINTYRVEAAKKQLISSNSRDKTILEIMYDVGFSSKSAFNTAFKKHTGVTPSIYRKENLS
jgi:AraC-like DNA-binding protein